MVHGILIILFHFYNNLDKVGLFENGLPDQSYKLQNYTHIYVYHDYLNVFT